VNDFVKRWLPWTVLPLLGGSTIAVGASWWFAMPRPEQGYAIDIEIATLLDEARVLQAQAVTPASMHEAELPPRRGLGDFTSELTERATRYGVRIVTVELAGKDRSGVRPPGAGTAPAASTPPAASIPPGPVGGATPGANVSSIADVTPERLDLELRVVGSFDHVVRFLHAVETNPRLTRIADLTMTPFERDVEARVVVHGFHFAGNVAAANPAATTPAMPGGR
jgi:hypothetical protein